MENTALAKKEDLALEVPNDLSDYTGYEGIDEDSLIIPRMKIVQPTSKSGNPGTFLLNLTEEDFEILENVTVIKVERGRVMWDRDNDSDLPICRSYDFMNPDPSLESPQSEVCAQYAVVGGKKAIKTICPMAMWVEKERPACNEVYNLLCIMDDGTPFWFAISGASIKPVRRYISAIALRKKRLWMFSTTLSLLTKTEPHKHYVLNFSTPAPLDKERLQEVADMVEAFRSETIETTMAAEEAAAQENGDNPEWMDEDGKKKDEPF